MRGGAVRRGTPSTTCLRILSAFNGESPVACTQASPFEGVLTLNIGYSNGTMHVRTRIKDEWKIIWCPDELPRGASGKFLRRAASIPISGIACDLCALMICVEERDCSSI